MRGFVGAVFGVLAMQAVGVVADAPTFDSCVVSHLALLADKTFVKAVN